MEWTNEYDASSQSPQKLVCELFKGSPSQTLGMGAACGEEASTKEKWAKYLDHCFSKEQNVL